jgi:hypothetical protein
MPQTTQILSENTLRLKYLKPVEGSEKDVEALTKQVNEWVKSRERSEVVGLSIKGNATKGFFAIITYSVIPR